MKTAIEWLYNELSKNNTSTDSVIQKINKESSIWEQAKQIEKDQIVNAFEQGIEFAFPTNGSYYYNQTFNQNK
jgi:hypothetical protein